MSITLPSEIWSLALAHLPLRDLTSASLVSRAWQRLLFSRLHHTVSFSRPCHLERLAGRITLENDDMSRSVSAHIREIVMGKDGSWLEDEYAKDIIREDDMEHLLVILKATSTRLEKLTWQLNFYPDNSELVELLETGCPNLRSFCLTRFDQPEHLQDGEIETSALIISG
jgi:hypothetical protein